MDANNETPDSDPNKPLTQRQYRFVQEYLLDDCATRAALRAGYSMKTARFIGCENLTKPNIRLAIEIEKAERIKRSGITTERVLQEVAILAFADAQDIRINAKGRIAPRFPGASRAVASLTTVRTKTKNGTRVKSTFRMHNKLPVLVELMRHLGLSRPDLPPLDNLLNRFPENVAAVVRKLMANPSLMPTSPPQQERIPDSQPSSDGPNE